MDLAGGAAAGTMGMIYPRRGNHSRICRITASCPKIYSGLGGAVYISYGCTPTFENCTFTNNFSRGGLNGICGQLAIGRWIDEPSIRYKIDNLGGAVYLAEGSSADFNNCTFTTNIADTNKLPASFDGFLGFGGAVAAEN